MARSSAEPSARYYHAAVGLGPNMFLWAGDRGDESAVASSFVEKFNVLSTLWQKPQQLRDRPLPSGYHKMAVATDGKKAYFFGGYAGPRGHEKLQNSLYHLDLSTLSCGVMVPTTATAEWPSARAASAMVHYRRKLVLYGGCIDSKKSTNELFVFDLAHSEALLLCL